VTPPWALSPWKSVGVAARRLGISERRLQLYIRAGYVQRLLATETPCGWSFSIHELEICRLGAWRASPRRRRRPASVGKGGYQLPLPLPAVVSKPESKPEPWTWAKFKPRMARMERTRAYREAQRIA
jgi:hypothetical protein